MSAWAAVKVLAWLLAKVGLTRWCFWVELGVAEGGVAEGGVAASYLKLIRLS